MLKIKKMKSKQRLSDICFLIVDDIVEFSTQTFNLKLYCKVIHVDEINIAVENVQSNCNVVFFYTIK